MPNAAALIQVNPQFQAKILRVGLEQTPVIVIDQFALDLTALRQTALTADFSQDADSYYPGVRAMLPRPYVIACLDALYQLIYQVYQVPTHLRLKPQDIYFSLINSAPEQLQPLQRMPHFDATSPYYFALLHYLQPGNFGGTGLFRHLPTQFERIDTSRQAQYFHSAQAYLDQHGLPAAAYCTASGGQFALYQQLAYQQNRMLVYPGNLLHSTLVNPASDIDGNPATGRLTANIFIQFQ